MMNEGEKAQVIVEEEKEQESNSIDEVEESLLRHWRYLYAENPDWFNAERLKIDLHVKAEVVDKSLSLILPELFNQKRKRQEMEEGEILRPLCSFQTSSKVQVLNSVTEVLRPRKQESEWHRKRREKEIKSVKRSKERRLLSKSRRDIIDLHKRESSKDEL